MNATNRIRINLLALGAAALALPGVATAQLDISWYAFDGGGGASSGGGLTVIGTIGQPDAGACSGGGLSIAGGFWPAGLPACYANCDSSTTPPTLNVNDFVCFLNRFAAGDPYANCDASTTPPTLNVNDFVCFLNRFAAGCS